MDKTHRLHYIINERKVYFLSFFSLMCWSFEKLRVIREYSSPRSLRAFTKVFIFLMPLLLSPYYVYSGNQTESTWAPYYLSVMVSFLFGSLQAVQDKLDDPFDGIGEDDVKLEQVSCIVNILHLFVASC